MAGVKITNLPFVERINPNTDSSLIIKDNAVGIAHLSAIFKSAPLSVIYGGGNNSSSGNNDSDISAITILESRINEINASLSRSILENNNNHTQINTRITSNTNDITTLRRNINSLSDEIDRLAESISEIPGSSGGSGDISTSYDTQISEIRTNLQSLEKTADILFSMEELEQKDEYLDFNNTRLTRDSDIDGENTKNPIYLEANSYNTDYNFNYDRYCFANSPAGTSGSSTSSDFECFGIPIRYGMFQIDDDSASLGLSTYRNSLIKVYLNPYMSTDTEPVNLEIAYSVDNKTLYTENLKSGDTSFRLIFDGKVKSGTQMSFNLELNGENTTIDGQLSAHTYDCLGYIVPSVMPSQLETFSCTDITEFTYQKITDSLYTYDVSTKLLNAIPKNAYNAYLYLLRRDATVPATITDINSQDIYYGDGIPTAITVSNKIEDITFMDIQCNVPYSELKPVIYIEEVKTGKVIVSV